MKNLIDVYDPGEYILFSALYGKRNVIDFGNTRENTEKSLSFVLGIDIKEYFQDLDFEQEKIKKSEYKVYLKNKLNLLYIASQLIDEFEINMLDDIFTDFKKFIETFIDSRFYKFSYEERVRILVFIKVYYLKKVKINELSKKFNNKELLEYVLGVNIDGKVEYEHIGDKLIFYVYDRKDFAKIYVDLELDILYKKNDKTNLLEFVYGIRLGNNDILELENSIILINLGIVNGVSNTLSHEIQHTLNTSLGVNEYKTGKMTTLKYLLKKDTIFIQDELLAFLREGFPLKKIKEKLSDEQGPYNKFLYIKSKHKKLYRYLWQEHLKQLKTSIQIVDKFQKSYPYDYINMLAMIDIEHWGKFAKLL